MIPMVVGEVVGVALIQVSNIAGATVIIIGMVVSPVLMVTIGVRLSLATLACLDPLNGGLGVVESLGASWRMVRPVARRLLLLYILTGLIVLGTFLMLLLGAFFLGYPLMLTTIGAAYCMIAAGARPAQAMGPLSQPALG